MDETVLIALISAAVSLIGIFYSAKQTRDKITQELTTSQALTNNEISHIKEDISRLEHKVNEHNNYASLIPAMQTDIKNIYKQLNNK